MKQTLVVIPLALIALLSSCNQKPEEPTLFTLVENSGIDFVNKVQDTKELNILNYRNFYNGGGAAIGDINNDGLADVFFTANQGSNKLYLNKGGFQFKDISDEAGFNNKKQFSTGVVMADINNDGWLDIFVCNAGNMEDSSLRRNQLFINDHNLGFTEAAATYGLDDAGYTTQVSFFDYDMDGDLDCFMINNSPVSPMQLNNVNYRAIPELPWPKNVSWNEGGDHLLRNDDGKFIDVTREAGIHGSLISFGLGVTVGDVNGDGYQDVYVSNDFYERDYLYINQKNGSFRDEAEQWLQHTSLASMGADFGDINNDGYPEIFTTDMLPGEDYRIKTTLSFEDINVYRLKEKNGFHHQFFQNTLQLNNKNGGFADIAHFAGVSATDWSWGGLMFDADNDGLTDLYVCNGIYHDLINQDFLDFYANDIVQKMILTGKKEELNVIVEKMPSIHVLNKAYRNNGNLRFTDLGVKWGFSTPSFSNGAAYGDLDNDGDLDVVVNNVNQPSFVYKNNARELNRNSYIAVTLEGKEKNRFAIGSIIKVYSGDQVMTREVIPSRGFQSSMDYKVVVGLGSIVKVDSMTIQWPDRSVSRYVQPALNKRWVIREKEEKKYLPQRVTTAGDTPVFTNLQNSFEKHEEDDYVDFFYEKNIPAMLSRQGPKAVTRDINGDGLEDVFIGGTKGHTGQVYLQKEGGIFIKKEEKALQQFNDFEDAAVLLFDCDKDNDADLLICAGGNDIPQNSRQLQFRLFKNNGQGDFTLDAAAFPGNSMNIGVAAANDFDNDGDLDLFIGARSVPQQYGLIPTSYLFVNDGNGHFTDIAKGSNSGLATVGMVTGAVWADMVGDIRKELVIVGEWTAPAVFSFDGNEIKKIKTNLDNLSGWWQSVTAADVNNDGKQDLVLGNIGENFYLRPDEDHPVKLWVNDFDQNGIIDKVVTHTINGKDMPVFLKNDLSDAMPFLKKLNLKHAEYALKSIQELIPAAAISSAITRQFNYSSSCVATNKDNGQFLLSKLPPLIQLSSVNAIHCMDVNTDGYLDLVLGGNQFNFQPQLGRLDASAGDILMNNGKGNFLTLASRQTGLALRGQLRDIVEIRGREKRYLLFLQNDEYPALYQANKYPGGK